MKEFRAGMPFDAPDTDGVVPVDLLREDRRLKALTTAAVFIAILASIPFSLLLAGFSLVQAVYGVVVAVCIAVISIEIAFRQMFKLRKRSAYPGYVALQLGALPSFDAACQNLNPIVDRLLRLKGSFLTLQNDSGFLSLVSLHNLSRIDADRYLRVCAGAVQRTLAERTPSVIGHDIPGDAIVPPGHRLVFVPVQSFSRITGVLALIGRERRADLGDSELLVEMGKAIGVFLEALRQRDDLRTAAAVDELTTVYNRRYFFDQLERELAASRRYGLPVSVLIFDLDGLKKINDSFGHGLGDEALRALAQRLVRYSRASDIVARLGGDEFAVILPRTDGFGADEIAQRLQAAVEEEPLASVPGRELRLGVSCGRASSPEDADEADLLLRQADGRMYAAKAARARHRDEQ